MKDFHEGKKKIDSRLIMVVNDEPDMAPSIKTLLESAGYTVDKFTDPFKALSDFKAGHYDLIILDVRMQNMNGFELYYAIKKIDYTCRVCFITAFEVYYRSLKEFFPDLDASCFIQKPVTKERLLQVVNRELEQS
ncbi:MAG: response regulator [Nitrososphaeraceae archaeon]|nr:response regulator [Nitrososphaeraceae archaeon]